MPHTTLTRAKGRGSRSCGSSLSASSRNTLVLPIQEQTHGETVTESIFCFGNSLEENSSSNSDILLKVIYFDKKNTSEKEKALMNYLEEPLESDILVGVDEHRRFYSLVSKKQFPINIQVKDVAKFRSVSM